MGVFMRVVLAVRAMRTKHHNRRKIGDHAKVAQQAFDAVGLLGVGEADAARNRLTVGPDVPAHCQTSLDGRHEHLSGELEAGKVFDREEHPPQQRVGCHKTCNINQKIAANHVALHFPERIVEHIKPFCP